MAVSGASSTGSAAAAAAARAAEEARRRAEEARRRAEEARRRAEAAKKAAEQAAKQAKQQAEQQKKLQEQTKKLQDKLKATKPEDTQAKNLKNTAEELGKKLDVEKAQSAKAEKSLADAQRESKEAEKSAQKATEEAEQTKKAAEAAQKTARLAESAKDKGEDFASEAIGKAEKNLGKKLNEASPEDAKKALDRALAADVKDVKGAGAPDGAKEVAAKAFTEEATANLKEALGKNAEKVLGDKDLAGKLQNAAQGAVDGLEKGVEKVGDGAQTLEAKLKSAIKDPAKAAEGVKDKVLELKDRVADAVGEKKAPEGVEKKADKVADKKSERTDDKKVEEKKDPKQAARESLAEEKKTQAEKQKEKAQGAVEDWKAKGREEDKAQKAAEENKEKLEREQKELQKIKNKPIEGPISPDAADRNKTAAIEKQQAKVDALSEKQHTLENRLSVVTSEKESARKTAMGEQDKAITAMQDANKAAKSAGQKQPYDGVNDLRSAADLASKPRGAEEKILGTRTAATKADAAKADAKRVDEAAEKGPAEAAAELRKQLKENDDPAYRAQLIKSTEGAQNKALQDAIKSGDQELLNDTVKSLGKSADMVGPDAVKQLGNSMQESASAGDIDFDDGWPMMKEAMKSTADSAAGRNVSRETANAMRDAGAYDRADEITALHPKLKDATAETTGQSRAREAAQVQTVSGEKDAATEQARSLNGQAKSKVEETEARAKEIQEQEGAKTKTVDGAKVTETRNARVTVEDGVTTVEKLNKKGDVTERTSVEQEGDSYKFESTTWAKGKAERNVIESDGDSSYQATVSYKEKPSAKPGAGPTVEDIKAGKVEGASVNETEFTRGEGEDLQVRNYSQDKTGITETTKDYGQQDDTEGVDGDVDDKFSDGPVDTVTTKTVQIPAPGTKDSEGEPVKPTVTEQKSYSQGDVKATSTETTTPEDFEDSGWDSKPLNADTLSEVKSKGEDIIAEDDPEKHPKQWTLDVNKGSGKMQSQTFVEGQPNLTSITTREAHGSSVTETTTNKFPDEDGMASETTSTATTRFDEYGRTVEKHLESEDREGVKTVQDFNMTRKETEDGIVYTESGKTTVTDEDGNTTTSEKETQSLMGAEGPQLLSSKAKVTDANGNVSTSRVDEKGSSYTLNGREITADELATLPSDQQETAAGALATTLGDVKTYAGYGNSALKVVGKTLDAFAEKSGTPGNARVISTSETANGKIKALERMAGTDALSKANRIVSGVAQFAGAGTSALGAVANGASFVNNIQQGNIPGAVLDAAQTFTSAKSTFKGIKGGVQTLRLGNGAVLGNAALDATGVAGGVSGKLTQAMNLFGDTGFGKFVGKLGGPLAVADVALSGYNFGKTLLDSNATTYQKVQAGIGFGGAVAAIAIGAAVGGPAVAAVGAVIGLATIGVQAAVDWFTDDEHEMADVQI